ncbi:MAG: T9SS type A sorting domain-containing protein [Candidatus Marinimicrobia bacterium]|nr:T9SS type A sorting domain-containing protein [Candidatus Neomarinimicrobiota bacterium]
MLNNISDPMPIDTSQNYHSLVKYITSGMILKILLMALALVQPLRACKLWAVCTRSEITFPSLSQEARSVVQDQLTSFYYQSQTMLDGWALLGYGDSLQHENSPLCRSADPATSDSALYWETVQTLLDNDQGAIGIGHLRVATSGSNSIPNPHPWMFYDNDLSYSLIHNGTVDKGLLHGLITEGGSDLSWLESNPPQTFGGGDWRDDGWGNVVDSELILLLIMKRIDGVGDRMEGFKVAMSDLVNAGVDAGQLNMVFSDGSSLMVFGGSNGLYVNEHAEYISVMTQPPSDQGSQWQGIGHLELICIDRDGLVHYPDLIESDLDEDPIVIPIHVQMSSAYPNPFNGSVYFNLKGAATGDISVSIYSLMGERVDQFLVPGSIEDGVNVGWNPPSGLASGTYFISAGTTTVKETQKILFIK